MLSVSLPGVDRGAWILTAYFATVAAANLLPLALILVEMTAHPGGVSALLMTSLASALVGWVTYRFYRPLLPIRATATGRVARWLAIPIASRWLMDGTSLRAAVNRHGSTKLKAASRRTLAEVVARSILAERIHAAAFVAGLPWIVLTYRFDAPTLAGFVAAINVVFQLYPVLVQRETRRRVDRITARPNRLTSVHQTLPRRR